MGGNEPEDSKTIWAIYYKFRGHKENDIDSNPGKR